jgi:2-oxoglutarate dehydrogenase E2 component (dihydrolipoamide succinyltransferase)
MLVNVVVPPLGESVSSATIAKWHKNEGQSVKVDELILELETDKVTLEVNAPASGIIKTLKFKEGDSVEVGVVLGAIEEGAVSSATTKEVANTQTANINAKQETAHVDASPAAAKIASERGINLADIQKTGRDGRATKEDVLSPQSRVVNNAVAHSLEDREQRVKMTRLRKTIAERLKQSQNTAAILTTFNEVDMSEIFAIRKAYQDSFVEKHGVKLGFMSFFVKACISALKNNRAVNAEIQGDEIIYKNYYDLGIAVGTEQGLVVPVLRDADKLSFAEIEKGIAELGKRARDGKLSMQDMTGATFSITNGGIYGSLLSTPIINPPQSGILGMHNIVEKPVVVNGEIVIRPMMYIALSYDHRIIDGKEAVTFLVNVKQMIEQPQKLLFDL